MTAIPLVSVLIPTYNGERFLDETLTAARKQTYAELEIIVRDDGSSDASLDIAMSHAAEDDRVSVIDARTRTGGFENYKALARLARGEFIKYCNQDDLLEQICVEELLEALMENSNVGLATSARTLIDENGVELPPQPFTLPLAAENAVLPGRGVIRHMLLALSNQIGEPSTTLFRSKLIDPDTMFDFAGDTYRVNCDMALWARLLLENDLYFHRAPLSSFRIHAGQNTAVQGVTIMGLVELATMLVRGVETGLLEDGPDLHSTGLRMAGNLYARLSAALQSGDPALAAYVPPLAEAIGRSWAATAPYDCAQVRTQSGRVAGNGTT